MIDIKIHHHLQLDQIYWGLFRSTSSHIFVLIHQKLSSGSLQRPVSPQYLQLIRSTPLHLQNSTILNLSANPPESISSWSSISAIFEYTMMNKKVSTFLAIAPDIIMILDNCQEDTEFQNEQIWRTKVIQELTFLILKEIHEGHQGEPKILANWLFILGDVWF